MISVVSVPLQRARKTRTLVMASALVLILLAWLVVAVGPARAAATLLSQGKAATASSVENAGTPASAAVDGNTGTRWSSAASDPQWLQVDLGSTATISQVVLQWETAYATAFQIQVSADASTWSTIYSTTTGTGGTQTLNISGSGRYVRMYGTARATGYGYSLWEFQVYGSLAAGGGCGTSNAALNKPATASSTENAGTPGERRGRRQRRYPVVERGSATRNGSRSTWAQRSPCARWCCSGRPRTRPRSRSRCPPTRRRGARSTRPRPAPAARRRSTVSGSGRYIRMYGTARATGYGYSLWEFTVNTPAAVRPRVRLPARRRARPPVRPAVPVRASTAVTRILPWASRPPPPRPTPPPATWHPPPPTATPAPAGKAPTATRSGSMSTSAPRPRSAVPACSGRPPTPRRSRSRYPTTTRPGARSTRPRPPPAGASR